MDTNSSVYVFDKKEVALIFVFMILIAVSSFALGIKIGKNYSYETAGYTAKEQTKVDLMSKEEEVLEAQVEEIVEAGENEINTAAEIDTTYKQLKEEFRNLDDSKAQSANNTIEDTRVESQAAPPAFRIDDQAVKAVTTDTEVVPANEFTGKFTIQLGSHRSLEEAQRFADAFRVRGYNPIINEVQIENRGTWYRVSLGVFDSLQDAKSYAGKEQSLLQGQDYVFARFD